MKRILSLILTIVMVCGMIPMMALWSSAATIDPQDAQNYPDLFVFDQPVYEVQANDGTNSVTVIGGVSEDVADRAVNGEKINYKLEFTEGQKNRYFDGALKGVYTTVTGYASTDMETALSQQILYIPNTKYIFALRINAPAAIDLSKLSLSVELKTKDEDGKDVILAKTDLEGNKVDVISFEKLPTVPDNSTSYYAIDDDDNDSNTKSFAASFNAGYSLRCGINNSLRCMIMNEKAGILTLVSPGYAKSVTIVASTNATKGRYFTVYGRNTPYSKVAKSTDNASLLIDSSVDTVLGTISVNSTPATLDIVGNYQYIALVGSGGGTNTTSISIAWSDQPQAEITNEQKVAAEIAALNPFTSTTVESGAIVDLPSKGTTYEDVTINWTPDNSGVTIASGKATFPTFTVDTTVTLKATAVCGDATSEEKSFTFTVKASTAPVDTTKPEYFLPAAKELASGKALDGTYTLTGVITNVNQVHYNNTYITVTIVADGFEEYPVQCFKIVNGSSIPEGQGIEVIKRGDTITVTGTIKKYNNIIEFDPGTLERIDAVGVSDEPDLSTGTDLQKVNAAYTYLVSNGEKNKGMSSVCTLTGIIVATKTDNNKKITSVDMIVPGAEDKIITCYRLKGEGVDELATGDVITVTGGLINYNNALEFSQDCTFVDAAQTDAYRAAYEAYFLTIDGNNGDTLPSAGETFKTIAITWSSSNTQYVTIVNNVLKIGFAPKGSDPFPVRIDATIGGTSTKSFEVIVMPKTSGDLVEASIDFSKQGYDNAAEVTTVTLEDGAVTITFSKGTGSNAPKYYTTGTAVRVYGGGTITISSTSKISKIVFTFASGEGSNAITADGGSYSNGTWAGSADSVVFTVGGSSGHRRIVTITVTYGD